MNELPLQELFTRLRQAGLPLGLNEYQLLLRALQGGFGIADRAALKRLCQTLWVKSEEERQVFDYYFDQVIGETALAAQPNSTQPQHFRKNRIIAISAAFLLGTGIVFVLGDEIESAVKRLFDHLFPPPAEIVEPSVVPAPQAEVTPVAPTPLPEDELTEASDREFDLVFWSLVSVIAVISGAGLAWVVDRWLKQRFANLSSANATPSTFLPQLTQKVSDEVQAAQAIRQVFSTEAEQERFLQNADYFPVTQRQMKRSWRYLNRRVREGVRSELDVEATIHQIGQQGVLLQPVLVPCRVNRAEILLLIDQDGSMTPFHALSQRLAETAVRGGRLGKTGIYYFHNCPVEYLYRDPYHQEAERIIDVLAPITSSRMGVLIFSDAGAARGGLNLERVDLTANFLNQLKQKVRYVVWLNPLPKSRWAGTTAGEIAQLVPMFEVSRSGLDSAIDVLRGRGS